MLTQLKCLTLGTVKLWRVMTWDWCIFSFLIIEYLDFNEIKNGVAEIQIIKCVHWITVIKGHFNFQRPFLIIIISFGFVVRPRFTVSMALYDRNEGISIILDWHIFVCLKLNRLMWFRRMVVLYQHQQIMWN